MIAFDSNEPGPAEEPNAALRAETEKALASYLAAFSKWDTRVEADEIQIATQTIVLWRNLLRLGRECGKAGLPHLFVEIGVLYEKHQVERVAMIAALRRDAGAGFNLEHMRAEFRAHVALFRELFRYWKHVVAQPGQPVSAVNALEDFCEQAWDNAFQFTDDLRDVAPDMIPEIEALLEEGDERRLAFEGLE